MCRSRVRELAHIGHIYTHTYIYIYIYIFINTCIIGCIYRSRVRELALHLELTSSTLATPPHWEEEGEVGLGGGEICWAHLLCEGADEWEGEQMRGGRRRGGEWGEGREGERGMQLAVADPASLEIGPHYNKLQHTATHCHAHCLARNRSALQRTATHCNTMQYTATHCNTLQHTLPRSK